MVYQRSSLRYAHTNGYTSLAYTEDGEFIITCGSDGDIRKWRGIDDDDPSSSCLGEFVICISHSGERLLASTDRNTLQAYTFPGMDNDGILLRFTAPVTCLRVHEKCTAAGSEDTIIKVLKNDETRLTNELHLQGHNGPVLALDVCVKGALLASAAGDGLLKIWNLEKGGEELKSIVGLPKVNSFENAICFGTPTFEPQHSNSLAYVNGKEVFVLNTSTWEVQCTLTDERITGEYTCCRFSSDGQYLAAGTTAGEISVFDFVRKQALRSEPPSSDCQAITCIAWSPKKNELAYCDATGQLGTLYRSDEAEREGADFADPEAELVDFGDIEFNNDNKDDVNGEDDDEDGVSIEKLKNKIMRSAQAYTDGVLPLEEDSRDSLAKSTRDSVELRPYVKTCKQQPAFQPGSTPSDLEHRYLAWNSVGIVTAHADSADGSIDVEFHDVNVHHSLHIPNYSNHNMASLSTSVLALAAEGGTKLVCIALAASGNKEWCVQFPDCESAEAMAATTKLIGVATSMHFLRLYTVMGSQREVLSIPGPVVAMAGHEDRLLVCYHSAPPSEQQQYLGAMLIQVNGLNLRIQHLSVPLTAGRQVSWLGFSDCGSPVFADNMGLLQLYSLKSNCWYPICDTLKQSQSVSNNYFVIAVSERMQIVQAVLCRGTSYPMTNPRPMTQELPLQLPLCDIELEKSQLEDTLMRAAIMNADNADKTIKETAIKLFALACRTEVEMRAKELIETIACPELLLLAVKYATKLGRIHLSDRLSELMPVLEVQSQQERQLLHESQQSLSLSPLPRTHTPGFGDSNGSGVKLAPKSMELNHVRRASLKRFAMSNTPTTIKKEKTVDVTEHTAASSSPAANNEPNETQENIFGSDTEKSLEQSREPKEMARTPLNSVNPFAAKRKLADVDFGSKGGILMGAAKLKLAKK